MNKLFYVLLLLGLTISCKNTGEAHGPQYTLKSDVVTVAFGSCNRENLPNPLWPVILEQDPDIWIWGGDNIYGDTEDMDVYEG
jgi:alkaline phosphatase D